MPADRARIAVAIPTFDEAGCIEATLARLEAMALDQPGLALEVLVIDDNSPDGTAGVVERWAMAHPALSIEVLRRPGKEGLGAAYIAGLAHLVGRDLDAVVQMDADGSHDAGAIPSMVAELLRGADLVIGSRYVVGGATVGWSAHRRLLSWGGNWYARLLLRTGIRDLTGGFNLISLPLLRRLDAATISSGGYGFLLELKHRAIALDANICEVPITFVDRVAGVSKLPPGTVWRSARLVHRLRSAGCPAGGDVAPAGAPPLVAA